MNGLGGAFQSKTDRRVLARLDRTEIGALLHDAGLLAGEDA